MTEHRLLFDAAFHEQKLMMIYILWEMPCMIFARLKGYLHCELMSNTVLVCNQKGYLEKFGKVCQVM
jgi:hypothetical protein